MQVHAERSALLRFCAIAFAVVVAWLGSAAGVWADGKVFPLIDHSASIPDQQALIVWDAAAKRETLIIETRYIGTGPGAAWVVPVPGVPEVRAATIGLFPTLQRITEPRLDRGEGWEALLFLAGLAWCGAGLLLLPKRLTLLRALIAVVGLISAFLLFTPALGKARSAVGGSEVEVLDRRIVGAFDTATVAGADGADLIAWLNAHGYAVDAACGPVIADYAKAGWVFVASRVRDDAPENGNPTTRTPHPLSFTFATDRPVYPMRLTGVGASSLGLDLYVLCQGEASAPGLSAAWRRPVYTDQGGREVPADARFIGHPAIAPLVARGAVLTRLSGTLNASKMTRDLDVTIAPMSGVVQPVAYAEDGARVRALALAAVTALPVMLAAAVSRRGTRPPARRMVWGGLMALLVGGATALGAYATSDVVTTSMSARRDARATSMLVNELASVIELNAGLRAALTGAADDGARLALVREHAAQHWRALLEADYGPLPEESDAPGGYTFSIDGDLVVLRHYDARALRVRDYSVDFRAKRPER